MRDDTAHGKVQAVYGENGKAGLPMEGTPLTADADGKLVPMPSYRTDIGKGTWYHAGYHLSTTIATPAAYAPLPFAFAALTWSGGIITLLAGLVVTFYCSCILAGLNEWNGIRYYRYRDLSASILGRKGWWATLIMQQIASIGNNLSIQIVAGISAKAIAKTYAPDSTDGKTLQEFIIYFGLAELCLSQLPDVHSLRFLNGIATFCTLGFTLIATALSITNGRDEDRSQVSYSLAGDKTFQVFAVLSALGTIAFSFGDTVLPEIQATCKDPPIKTMRKGIFLAYSLIGATYFMLAIAGYWAFGNSVQPFLLNSLSHPTWAVTLANLFAIIQVLGCYQIYCRPTYEPLELRFMRKDEKPFSMYNALTRLAITTTYVVIVTTIACMVPFFGDFVALCGSIGFTPIDFLLPCILWNVAKKPGWIQWSINWIIIIVYSAVGIVGAVGAIYFIQDHAQTYSVFANL